MTITVADIQTITKHAVEIGLQIPREPSNDRYMFACASDTPTSVTFRYGVSAIVGDAGVTIAYFIGGKQYTVSLALEQFLKLDEQTFVDLVKQAQVANEAYEALEEQLKQLKTAHRTNVINLLKK